MSAKDMKAAIELGLIADRAMEEAKSLRAEIATLRKQLADAASELALHEHGQKHRLDQLKDALADANRGAETNAKMNRSLAEKLAASEASRERMRAYIHDYFMNGVLRFGEKSFRDVAKELLAESPAATLRSHDLALAERVFKTLIKAQFPFCEKADVEEWVESLWLASDIRRELTEGA